MITGVDPRTQFGEVGANRKKDLIPTHHFFTFLYAFFVFPIKFKIFSITNLF